MGLLDLFVASSIPVLKLLLVTGLGSYLALDHVNLLGNEARKNLNDIVFYVFNPSLVSSNLAQSITFESMVHLWFMPFNILITFIIGSILGWVVTQLTKAPAHLRGLIIGCCAGGNLGTMLLIIIPAVCKEKASPFGDPVVCNKSGMAYASLSMATGAVYLWSYVYNIIRICSNMSSKVEEISDSPTSKPSGDISSPSEIDWTEPLLSSSGLPESEDQESQLALPQQRYENKPENNQLQVSFLDKIKMFLKKTNLRRLFAPSSLGALVGFVVGVIPPIQKLMIGDSAPLRVIQDSALLLGDAAIPALTLILGGNLLRGLKGSGIRKSIIIGILLVRYLALPLIGIAVLKGAVRLGLVHDDPLYQFVLLFQFSLPPAMNIGTMTQMFGAGESECSVIMLWCYASASVALTLWSTFYLWLIS
ncbi:protein PIN-LIKES 3-like isoform X2 [Andrographis paniculata]|uniref:protein PIN-LIKES 3-like isoform X2 n=1 Tax=Andrographis paniculata TaxID=175694 RepID=UPI0021E88A74|nr:protein PIN-LIKES 3-like isoform X2 [Andrographis paniculata]